MQNLSIIIPVYNDRQGLILSLLSLSQLKQLSLDWMFNIIIIDDCSVTDQYNDIPQTFSNFFNKIILLKTEYNCGPGQARQLGLNNCNSEYVMFLDAGDIISSVIHFTQFLEIVSDNPDVKMFSSAHEEITKTNDITYIDATNNRLHGKIYRLDFLQKYDITFIKGNYYSEDVGFNTACRLICYHLEKMTHELQFIGFEKPTISWMYSRTSITRKDDCAYRLFENRDLGPNIIHAFEIALKNNVNIQDIEIRGYEFFVCLYIFYYEAFYHNAFLKENIEGCLQFYKYFFKKLFPCINKILFEERYSVIMKEIYQDSNFIISTTIPKFSIWDFMDFLEKEYKKE